MPHLMSQMQQVTEQVLNTNATRAPRVATHELDEAMSSQELSQEETREEDGSSSTSRHGQVYILYNNHKIRIITWRRMHILSMFSDVF